MKCLCRALTKKRKKNHRRSYIPDSSPFEDSLEEYMYKIKGDEDYKFVRPRAKTLNLSPCNSSEKGLLLSNILLTDKKET